MQKKINELIDQLPNKSEFGRELAEAFKIQYTSIKQNWIYGQSIPKEHQEEVLLMLKKTLKK